MLLSGHREMEGSPVRDDHEKFLLAEYEHFADGFFKNEEIGERRIQFFITVATAVLGGVVVLLTSDHVQLSKASLRQIATAALLSVLLLGVVTFGRILQRDRVTDEYKGVLRYLREQWRRRSPGLEDYDLPFRPARHWLLRGSLALIAALMNSVLLASAVAVWYEGGWRWPAAMAGFLVSFAIQAIPVRRRDSRGKRRSQVYRAGAGAVIANERGQVLALKRRDVPNAWQLPQGGLECGEEPFEAIIREIREETGITRSHLRQVVGESPLLAYELPRNCRSQKTGRGQVHHWFLFRYDGSDEAIDLGDGKEFEGWKWTSLEQLADEVVSFKRPVYRELLRLWSGKIGGPT